jgi:hypothetical protein
MAGEKRGSGPAKTPDGKRRRPQPTINLTATEIPSEPSAAPASSGVDVPPPAKDVASSPVDPTSPAAEATAPPAAAETDRRQEADTPLSPAPAAAATPSEPVAPAQPVAETTDLAAEKEAQPAALSTTERSPGQNGEKPASGPDTRAAGAARPWMSPAASPTERSPDQNGEKPTSGPDAQQAGAARPWMASAMPWIRARIVQSSPLMGAAVGAGAAALVAIGVIAGLWKTGVMAAHDERLPSVAARVGELEKQVRQFAARPALASDERIAAIGQRVFENEHVLIHVNQRLATTEQYIINGNIDGDYAIPQVKQLHGRLAAEFATIVDARMAGSLDAERARVTELGERLAKIEESVRRRDNAPTEPLPRTDESLATSAVLAQVRELEARLANTDASLNVIKARVLESGPAGRSADADGAIKSLTDAAAALRKRVDDVAGLAQAANDAAAQSSGASSARAAEIAGSVEATTRRTAALEESLKGLQAAASRPRAPDVDRAARFAVATVALRGAVERGDPFVAELTAVKPLVSDQAPLAPLEPFAATGVPGAGALARELSSLAVTLRRAPDHEPQGGGVLERLQAGAGKLVRIRPVDAPAAAEPGNAIALAEAQAMRGDLAGALATLAQLPAAERAPFEPWIRKAAGRATAVEQVGQLARAALDALGKTR